MRAVLRDTQLVEQLVEVPILSFSSLLLLQAISEQYVGIPVVSGSGTGGGLSGFLPGQSYPMTAERIVDNPVPRPGGAWRSSRFTPWTQFNSFPIQVEVFKIFSQSRAPQHLLRFLLATGFFAFFPPEKSAKFPRTQGSELGVHS